ncbi:7614_t:CDS:2, partial [Gigaspora rosea]
MPKLKKQLESIPENEYPNANGDYPFLSKETFYNLYNEHMKNNIKENFSWDSEINDERYNEIISVLEDPKSKLFNKDRRIYIKTNYKTDTVKGQLAITYTSLGKRSKLKDPLLLVKKDEIYARIAETHILTSHGGQNDLYDKIKIQYGNIKQWMIKIFVNACTTCQSQNSIKTNKISAKIIVSNGFLSRVQVDIIDFSQNAVDDYKYVVHARDHFSRFSWARAIKSKTALEVAIFLYDIFTTFGPPSILHSDNGAEFTANIIKELCELWNPMKIKIVHGKPRHPQSQGSIERGNHFLIKKLGKWMINSKNKDWTIGLRQVVIAMNNSYCRALKTTPYQAVFDVANILNDPQIINEQDIENDIEMPEYVEDLSDLEDNYINQADEDINQTNDENMDQTNNKNIDQAIDKNIDQINIENIEQTNNNTDQTNYDIDQINKNNEANNNNQNYINENNSNQNNSSKDGSNKQYNSNEGDDQIDDNN